MAECREHCDDERPDELRDELGFCFLRDELGNEITDCTGEYRSRDIRQQTSLDIKKAETDHAAGDRFRGQGMIIDFLIYIFQLLPCFIQCDFLRNNMTGYAVRF